jgi:uncharacterized membrane-anchored protein
MISSLSPAKKLAIVVAIQFLILLSVIGFKQYTIWTSETVLLKTTPVDPRDLLRSDFVRVQYDISTIDLDKVAGDDQYGGSVYVELQRGDDGYWSAVALHGRREHSFDGTVLIEGDAAFYGPGGGSRITVTYGIEQVFVPEGAGDALPSGRNHTVAVEVKVDRFGNAVPRRFFVDGQPFDLSR